MVSSGLEPMRTIVVLTALLTALSSAAEAATHLLYTQSRFAEAQAQGKRILVYVQASWCATCSRQASTLVELEKNHDLNDLLVFTIDFDLNKDAVKWFKVPVQSTLILFYGRTEIGRLTGESNPLVINTFLNGAPSRFAQVKALSMAGHFLALLAGILSIFSPCILPLLPIILAAAATSHRFGPMALGAGLMLFLVTIGLFIDTIGLAIGVDSNSFRLVGAMIMAVFGLVLLSHPLQHRIERLAAPLQTASDRLMTHMAPSGLVGQFLVGALLGMVWSPCIGPTLGAAIALASQGKSIGHVAVTMFFFGVGTALPLVLISAISRNTLVRWQARINVAGHVGHAFLGFLLLLLGVLILSGTDRYIETKLLQVTPDWLNMLVTRY